MDRNQLWFHYAHFTAAIEDLDPPSESFKPTQLEHPQLRVYALEGNHTLLVWCRDRQNTWQRELQDQQPPELLSGILLDLAELLGDRKVRSFEAYDPWQNRWETLSPNGNRVPLPPFSRSLILRFAQGD